MKKFTTLILAVAVAAGGSLAFSGCEQKEEVLDMETPAGGVSVERSEDQIDIQIDEEGESPKDIHIELNKDNE